MGLHSRHLSLVVGHCSFVDEQLCILAYFRKDLRRLSITREPTPSTRDLRFGQARRSKGAIITHTILHPS